MADGPDCKWTLQLRPCDERCRYPMPVVSSAMSRQTGTVTDPDVLSHSRLRPMVLTKQVGVSAARRTYDVHRSIHYRWKARVERWGLE